MAEGNGSSRAAMDAALARARRHAAQALSEALLAGRALLDAAALATSGVGAAEHPLFATADAWVASRQRELRDRAPLASELGVALAEALDAEIRRWEDQARNDDEARAVLRAFLGLRELLWELGVGRSEASSPRNTPAEPTPRSRPARRVERVPVEGGAPAPEPS
ncbi:MAG: hypothetical protein AAF430_19705 [Myxococcota bacterium]